jgi:hypothetical protein
VRIAAWDGRRYLLPMLGEAQHPACRLRACPALRADTANLTRPGSSGSSRPVSSLACPVRHGCRHLKAAPVMEARRNPLALDLLLRIGQPAHVRYFAVKGRMV